MSFQDLKYGAKQSASSSSSSSAAVAAAIFEINTSVAAFGRLVDALGTSKDTPDHRLNLQKTRQRILQLVKYTSSNLKSLSQSHAPSSVTASKKKIEDAKLARDFQSALQHFQTLLHLSSHRESSFTPSQSSSSSSSSSSSFPSPSRSAPTEAVEYSADQPLLMEHKRKEVVMVGNEIAFNEAIIEEREQGIRDIEEQIGEANEIFKDLAVLVHEQGVVIDDIHSHIEDSSAATTQTRVHLAKASKSVKSRCSLSLCWWVVVVTFVVALVIFLVVLLQ